jgi:TRAP-type mannitol/chloroaromatic compound transport system permease large subunit
MSDPALGLMMLGLIVVVIMLGFPTAFTLMGLGMMFGFAAFYDPAQPWTDNKVFDLMVQRTYGGMTNDTLLSVPLFVLMGYVMERGALVDKMFHSIQLAFRRLPASLAVATLVVCTFWGIASGLVGAVVVLMGVIAMKPMLNAGYDTRLASGVITAGGTLGILIPPSVMIIVYAAVAGQSVVKLYAAAMLPGFFLAFLYLVYVIGWAILNPKVAPKLPPEAQTVPIPAPLQLMSQAYSSNMLVASIKAFVSPARMLQAEGAARITFGGVVRNLMAALFPLVLALVTLYGVWWYVVIHQQAEAQAADAPVAVSALPAPAAAPAAAAPAAKAAEPAPAAADAAPAEAKADEPKSIDEEPKPIDANTATDNDGPKAVDAAPQSVDAAPQSIDAAPGAKGGSAAPAAASGPPPAFFTWFWGGAILTLMLVAYYYLNLRSEQFEILKLLIESVMPLGILTVVVLAVILLGIATATESAAIGAAGAFYLAGYGKYPKRALWGSVLGAIIGLGMVWGKSGETMVVGMCIGAMMLGGFAIWLPDLLFGARKLKKILSEAVFLTAKTTAMVCWLFVGSALFSAVFAILGGQQIIEHWVLSMNLTPLQFMLLSQAIIFILGWPLEWTEIIVIFVPIFLPLLKHFEIDPILWGTLVFVNLQAAFLSPPVAMSAFYLKGVSPPHVTLNQIFSGMMPYMLIVILCMVFMYIWPGMTLWLPRYLYGG